MAGDVAGIVHSNVLLVAWGGRRGGRGCAALAAIQHNSHIARLDVEPVDGIAGNCRATPDVVPIVSGAAM